MFNSIRIKFHRVHLYRQSIFNSHQDSISSTHGLFQNQNLEITSVIIPECQSPIFENSGLESPNFAEMSRPQQVRTDDHLFLQSQGQALTHSIDYDSALSTASAPFVTTAPTYITARRKGLFHNNGQNLQVIVMTLTAILTLTRILLIMMTRKKPCKCRGRSPVNVL